MPQVWSSSGAPGFGWRLAMVSRYGVWARTIVLVLSLAVVQYSPGKDLVMTRESVSFHAIVNLKEKYVFSFAWNTITMHSLWPIPWPCVCGNRFIYFKLNSVSVKTEAGMYIYVHRNQRIWDFGYIISRLGKWTIRTSPLFTDLLASLFNSHWVEQVTSGAIICAYLIKCSAHNRNRLRSCPEECTFQVRKILKNISIVMPWTSMFLDMDGRADRRTDGCCLNSPPPGDTYMR